MRLKLYPIVSRLAAGVLLLAGLTKVYALLSSPRVESQSWTTFAAIPVELLLGGWLLIGRGPRWGRLAALAFFVVLFNIAFMRLFDNKPSCGCFGNVAVQTLAVVILDAVMVLAFLVSSPVVDSGTASRGDWLRSSLGMLTILALIGLIGWQVVITLPRSSARPTSSSDKRVLLDELAVPTEPDPAASKSHLERVIEGVQRNHDALKSLECTLHVALTTYSAPLTSASDAAAKEKKTEPRTQQLVMRLLLQGEDARLDCETNLPDYDAREIQVDTGGKSIQYLPGLRQAWLNTAASVERRRAEAIDLRCAGFQPPIRSIAEWLRRAELLRSGARRDDKFGEIVQLQVLSRGVGGPQVKVALDCASALSFLPIRVVYHFQPAESIFTVADLDYQKVDAAEAWFPKKWKYRSFIPGATTDPDAVSGYDLMSETEVRLVSVNREISAEEFDPLLPPNTRLVGTLAAQPRTGDTPVRVSTVLRAEPVPPTPPAPQDLTPWLWVLSGIDAAALGLCLILRRDLAL